MAVPEETAISPDDVPPTWPVGMTKLIPNRARLVRRILLLVTALNLAGITLMWVSTQTGSVSRPPGEIVPTGAYLIESVGFALMLPGIFFASITLLLSRVFGWNEGTTCAVWYFSAGFINVLLARSTSDGLRNL